MLAVDDFIVGGNATLTLASALGNNTGYTVNLSPPVFTAGRMKGESHDLPPGPERSFPAVWLQPADVGDFVDAVSEKTCSLLDPVSGNFFHSIDLLQQVNWASIESFPEGLCMKRQPRTYPKTVSQHTSMIPTTRELATNRTQIHP